jgi:hypothetical protein
MQIDRRTALLGAMAMILTDTLSAGAQEKTTTPDFGKFDAGEPGIEFLAQDNTAYTLTMRIAPASSFVFKYGEHSVVFTADEIWAALSTVVVPSPPASLPAISKPDDHCAWDDFEEREICE